MPLLLAPPAILANNSAVSVHATRFLATLFHSATKGGATLQLTAGSPLSYEAFTTLPLWKAYCLFSAAAPAIDVLKWAVQPSTPAGGVNERGSEPPRRTTGGSLNAANSSDTRVGGVATGGVPTATGGAAPVFTANTTAANAQFLLAFSPAATLASATAAAGTSSAVPVATSVATGTPSVTPISPNPVAVTPSAASASTGAAAAVGVASGSDGPDRIVGNGGGDNVSDDPLVPRNSLAGTGTFSLLPTPVLTPAEADAMISNFQVGATSLQSLHASSRLVLCRQAQKCVADNLAATCDATDATVICEISASTARASDVVRALHRAGRAVEHFDLSFFEALLSQASDVARTALADVGSRRVRARVESDSPARAALPSAHHLAGGAVGVVPPLGGAGGPSPAQELYPQAQPGSAAFNGAPEVPTAVRTLPNLFLHVVHVMAFHRVPQPVPLCARHC